ncbi:saccharopine dehydrogenase [Micromonospora sp. HNM0581]|uniref:saccharopine dehydrogenase family protein n=1 Tax=Micromonospora sp. HNM0581 TaxID=2716341 RepID=UPI00146BC8D2|nr:saccharopine dehydrogenase family protein [Micromonospora sp. HNM0581]NLU80657.1 saccharopine dehydrogenase [Micromonospora sp. HNM0581]
MGESTAASGTVHWVGTGLSTGSGLALLCEQAERLVLWGRTDEQAAGTLDRLGLTGRAEARALTDDALADAMRPGDVLVSMLPATEHLALLRSAIDSGAHFACSSYLTPEIAQAATAAGAADLVVLTEVGLDPGIDHLMAHSLVQQAIAATGPAPGSAAFVSYCGGLPAVPNEFRYRFSWAPRGVLNALRSPARYVAEGIEQTAERPWEATREFVLDDETFEVYPNRDSMPYVAKYAFPAAWTVERFVRGTLRLAGWRAAWSAVFEQLTTGDEAQISALAADLATRYPTTPEDRDRVVLVVGLRLTGDDGVDWGGEYVLDLVGNDVESAMARTVSVPLAIGVGEVLDGRARPGLHQAATDDAVDRWLGRLRDLGIDCQFRALQPAAEREGTGR